jgi:hypothetical protein
MKKGGKAAKAKVMYKPGKSAGPAAPAAAADKAEPKPVFESYQAR